jgi:hypothetical protein
MSAILRSCSAIVPAQPSSPGSVVRDLRCGFPATDAGLGGGSDGSGADSMANASVRASLLAVAPRSVSVRHEAATGAKASLATAPVVHFGDVVLSAFAPSCKQLACPDFIERWRFPGPVLPVSGCAAPVGGRCLPGAPPRSLAVRPPDLKR